MKEYARVQSELRQSLRRNTDLQNSLANESMFELDEPAENEQEDDDLLAQYLRTEHDEDADGDADGETEEPDLSASASGALSLSLARAPRSSYTDRNRLSTLSSVSSAASGTGPIAQSSMRDRQLAQTRTLPEDSPASPSPSHSSAASRSSVLSAVIGTGTGTGTGTGPTTDEDQFV